MPTIHPAKHSESLANGMAKTSLRDIDRLVTEQSDRLLKTLRRKATSPTTTKKGAKKLLITINKQLAPLAVTALSIQRSRNKSTTTAWLLPHIENKQLQLATHIVEQSKEGVTDVNVSPSVIITMHAISRLMHRDVELNDVDWPTLRDTLGPLVGMMWPVFLAHRTAGHKQFALPSPRGLFIGTFEEDSGLPVVRTYIDGVGMSRKWQAVTAALVDLSGFMEALAEAAAPMLPDLHTPKDRLLFLVRSNALGLGVEPMKVLTKAYYEHISQPEFNWMKDET